MSKGIKRELYLLPRGEQRALILLSLLLIISLLFRITVGLLPVREPEGMEEFEKEARRIIAAISLADSLQAFQSDSVRQSTATIPPPAYRSPDSYKKGRQSGPININRADSAQLLPLPGIGPVFAGRIIKYRNLLGGFACIDQLKEVYGINAEMIDMLAGRIIIDTTALAKLDLNRASFKDLLRHPYLEYEDVLSLVKYRDFAGTIQSPGELLENHILADSVLQKVKPYLY